MSYRKFGAILVALLCSRFVSAATVFDFSGACTSVCIGDVSAELKLIDDYQFGEQISSDNLLSFTLNTSLGSKTYTSNQVSSLSSGGLLKNGAGTGVNGGGFEFQLVVGSLDGIGLYPGGVWRGGINNQFIGGDNGEWNLRAVPVPPSGILYISALFVLTSRVKKLRRKP